MLQRERGRYTASRKDSVSPAGAATPRAARRRRAARGGTHLVQAGGSDRARIGQRGCHQVVGQDVLHPFQRLVKEVLGIDAGMLALHLRIAAGQADRRARGCGRSPAGPTRPRRPGRR